ncbi:MAG: hypothetical protein FD132_710 [bacterium]|nr:MAG: hypothetical protein FD132_710 [bacterium]
MAVVGLGLARAGRMNPLEAIGGGHKCKDSKGIQAMLAKAKELEVRRKDGEG